MRDYKAIQGSEAAHLYRSRLRELELEHARLEAAKVAGDDVDASVVAELEGRMDALEKAAQEAERAPKAAGR